jgi:hypothetical protein
VTSLPLGFFDARAMALVAIFGLLDGETLISESSSALRLRELIGDTGAKVFSINKVLHTDEVLQVAW